MFTRAKTHTLAKDLKLYSRMMILYSILLTAAMLFVICVYVAGYHKMAEQANALESLSGAFSRMKDDMQLYGMAGDETYLDDYNEMRQSADRYLDVLEKAEIGGSYARNLGDLRRIFDAFCKKQEELTWIFSEEAADKADQGGSAEEAMDNADRRYYSEVYGQLEEIWQSIERREAVIRVKMNQSANWNREKMERTLGRLAVLLLAEISIFCLLFWKLTSRKEKEILEPIEALTKEAQRICEEPLDHFVLQIQNMDVQDSQIEEIHTLAGAFQRMLCQIQSQVMQLQENSRAREAFQRQEIQNLQMRMNPHFLFNTLNMIRQNAYLGKSEKTVYLLEETAALLRYNLSYTGKPVTLQQELEGLDHYISLQEERFEDRIAFEFQLDERFHQVCVPCFILQPFVENSISHGMREINGTLLVKICTQYDAARRCGRISVEDNGQGMDRQKLEKVRREMQKDDWENKKSMGMSNVYRRLMLFTGGKAHLEVFSEPGKGTKIEIGLPCREDGSREE